MWIKCTQKFFHIFGNDLGKTWERSGKYMGMNWENHRGQAQIWEWLGKTLGMGWENHRKTIGANKKTTQIILRSDDGHFGHADAGSYTCECSHGKTVWNAGFMLWFLQMFCRYFHKEGCKNHEGIRWDQLGDDLGTTWVKLGFSVVCQMQPLFLKTTPNRATQSVLQWSWRALIQGPGTFVPHASAH